MKGVVFTEFLGFVTERYGDDMVDDVIDACQLPSGGAYTAVGTYSHDEMTALCGALSRLTGEPVEGLVRDFGTRLSASFAAGFPAFFERSANFFDFIVSIEAHIHIEVRKLYPDAQLPSFTVAQRTRDRLVMIYSSPRRMGRLAEGLILGSAQKFGVTARVEMTPIDGSNGDAMRIVIDVG